MSGLDGRQPTDADWLALCLVTESDRPAEWPAIAQVIENRLKSGRWGPNYREVVLARKQFSAFNVVSGRLTSLTYSEAWGIVAREQGQLLLVHAGQFVGRAMASGWMSAITPATLHYYSPVSMRPAGSRPAWAKAAKRLYTPPGLEPERFVFAEAVP